MTKPVPSPTPVTDTVHRVNHAIGPIAAGMIVDSLDLLTFGPIGVLLGVPIGALAGYWLGRSLGLDKTASLLCAAAAAVYCTVPFTEILPLGTLFGALGRFQNGGGPAGPPPSDSTSD